MSSRLSANTGWLALNRASVAPAAPILQATEQALRQAIALDAENPSAWRGLGLTLAWQGRVEEAVAALRTAGPPGDGLVFLGDSYWQRDQPQLALAWYEQAVAAQPDLATAWRKLGQAEAALDQPAEALAAYQTALTLDPAAAEIYFALGELFAYQRQYSEADGWYRQALEREPDKLDWWLARANTARAAGKLPLAIELYQVVITRLPDSARAYYELAQAERLSENRPAALAAIEKALSLGRPAPFAHYLRAGEIYEWAGLREKSLEAYQLALALRPNSERARRGVERLLENG